jgi:hypothetical protein
MLNKETIITAGSIAVLLPWSWDSVVGVFGRSNVGFLVLILCGMVVELFTCVAISRLSPDPRDDFEWVDLAKFWLRKSVLLCLPAVGFAVDIAWYWMSEPSELLGLEIKRYTTKAVVVGVFGYQTQKVLQNILLVYQDMPLVLWLVRTIDKIQIAALDEGDKPRSMDRRWYDKASPTRDPYGMVVDNPNRGGADAVSEPERGAAGGGDGGSSVSSGDRSL